MEKTIKMWVIRQKRGNELAIPDVFPTQAKARKRMQMNEYYKHQKHMVVVPCTVTYKTTSL